MAIKILKEDYLQAEFITRLNRFVIQCKVGSEITSAYLPNPGRLIELLIKGATLYLVNSHKGSLRYKVIAVLKGDSPVLLDTHLNNLVAKTLLQRGLIKGLDNFDAIKNEVKVGQSRFDFMLTAHKDKHHYLEVKSCTLFGRDIALFPDAPTKRGIKHLKELSELSAKGFKGHVLFIVHSQKPSFFMPDYHTDIDFSKTFLEVYKNISIRAVGIKWNKDLQIEDSIKELQIPIDIIEQEAQDRGSYMILFKINNDQDIDTGSLGRVRFKRGYYIYTGSAMKNLCSRIERHKRKLKNKFWHIDYLTGHGQYINAFAIRTSERIECQIADKMHEICEWTIANFGASDCGCKGHLFGFNDNPILSKDFVECLLWFRIDRFGWGSGLEI